MEKNEEYSAEKSKINRRNALGIIGGVAAGSLLTSAVEKARTERFPAGSLRKRFEGKVVVITGATSGIGRAAAVAFASEGAKVAFCGRRENLGHQVEAQIKAQGKRVIAYTPAQLRALAQAEFELNRIALIAAAEKTVNTSPLFKRWRLPGADISSDAQSKEPCSTSTISVQNSSANGRDDQ